MNVRNTFDFVEAPAVAADDIAWDRTADVVVVGLGAAGAAAAIEAADQGAGVLVLDRLNGGGASAISGGVVYAGGGTSQQREAGIEDDPDNMFRYLKEQVAGIVADGTLRDFCDGSAANLAWLEAQGARFSSHLMTQKNSFPGGAWGLYYSGNEAYAPFSDKADPAPRGHIVQASGYATGHGLMKALIGTLKGRLRERVGVIDHCEAFQLLTDAQGRLLGLRCRRVGGPLLSVRRLINRVANGFMMGMPGTGGAIRRLARHFGGGGATFTVRARRGLILASGGFVFNREMVAEATRGKVYSPMPLGEECHGSGIKLGQSMGGAVGQMDRLTYWRFYAPPVHFLNAVLVGPDGRRICNEALYGATVADRMIEQTAGRGWLILDQKTLDKVRNDMKQPMPVAQKIMGWLYLARCRTSAPTLDGLAASLGIDAAELARTLAGYNQRIEDGREDEFRKPDGYRSVLAEGPWHAVEVSIGAAGNPCFSLTLGGLRVDEASGRVLREDGSTIAGLYAAGRSAVGICSHTYISGLSLADCVFSGRRAGRHAAGAVC
ncbi:hypothetical protein B9N43_15155 [Denitratisoma sp. DHT3]|uniref:FAD-binding protein n=1 Tax=Denitratisoma sp. DHT3 TaxID=1981880 RepID=UPI0011987E3B|nr:FAD-binding protein [Denitratisoma sp. DHT3]QDX82456.1 hypothetical protein B9N43_15155 [Denitratisoma sp. DHT3]